MALKTLLIGLGGTGCQVVARVKRLINTQDPNVQFIGFDTDSGLKECENLTVIYTSREMPVSKYLKGVQDWEKWFPDDPSLKNRNMIKGAGQTRVLSRLAFAETVNQGRIKKLEDAIKELRVSRGEVTPNNFRIMIVSSFAGGTGSGMFIQTALFLRRYIHKNYGGEVMIRGLFAMPDLYMSNEANRMQKESMYANAYAALKELNSINKVCLSTDKSAKNINLTIDDLFDSKRDIAKAGKKPFDFIFFVDNLNETSHVLQTTEDYMQLMTTATYMQVYSPMTETGDSREDNFIQTLIKEKGKPLYGSVGAAKIVYPYQDLVDYCGLRATVDSISDVWTFIDDMYRKDNAENKKNMKHDQTIKDIDRADHFINTVDSIIKEKNIRFSFIGESTRIKTENVDIYNSPSRADSFYNQVRQFIGKTIKENKDIEKVTPSEVKKGALKKNIGIVDKYEQAFKNYYAVISDKLRVLSTIAVQSIIPDDFTLAISTDSEYCILKLLKNNGYFIHPLAMRMMLYELRRKVAETFGKSKEKIYGYENEIQYYFEKAYDLEATKEVEKAQDRAKNLNIIAKRKFIKEYMEKSGELKRNLAEYTEQLMYKYVFEKLLIRIDALIKQFERLFDNLESIKTELQKEIDSLQDKKHSNTGEPSIYLCASPSDKKEIYESLQFDCSENNDNGVYDLIFYSLYDEARASLEAKKDRVMRFSERELKLEQNKKISSIFHESVVKRNILDISEKYVDQLDINVYEAMLKMNNHELKGIESQIESVEMKAKPFLRHDSIPRIIQFLDVPECDNSLVHKFWGIHPEVKDEILNNTNLNDIREFFAVGDFGENPEVVSDEEYSKYEISCYEALYCVSLDEIPKFRETGDSIGVYYDNYANRIKQMIIGEVDAITPHLDIRWHLSSYLSAISAEKKKEDDINTARTLWLALIYQRFNMISQGKEFFLYVSYKNPVNKQNFSEPKYPESLIKYNGKNVKINNIYEIFKALQLDEIMSERLNEIVVEAFNMEKKTALDSINLTGARANDFTKRLIVTDVSSCNALNTVARFVSHAGATYAEKSIFVKALVDLINEYCSDFSEEKTSEFKKRIFENSMFNTERATKTSIERFITFADWDGRRD